MSSSKPTFRFLSWVCNDEDEEVEFVLPGSYYVCPVCDGKGTRLMAVLRGVAITEEDRGREWSYDVECEKCKGLRVAIEPDRIACSLNPYDRATLIRYDEDRARDASEQSNEGEWDTDEH